MTHPRIKICGITHSDDALLAAGAGADAIGMVFYPEAKRCVSLETARGILRVLPPFVTPVGLFVDQDLAEITEIGRALGLRHIQLHGHEGPDLVSALRDFVVLKAIRCHPDTLAAELKDWRENIQSLQLHNLRGLILETATSAPGGTGIENDWPLIADLQRRGIFDGLPALIAAGGLNAANVGAVITKLRPWAVDVSSGVEASPGRKSADKINAFICAARSQ